LYPSARPPAATTVEGFVARMQGLAKAGLRTFKDRTPGAEIRVFGNVAVAMAACEFTENDEKISRGVEAMLLVKDEGRRQIVVEKPDRPIPPAVLSG
jgi:hypothetical protein